MVAVLWKKGNFFTNFAEQVFLSIETLLFYRSKSNDSDNSNTVKFGRYVVMPFVEQSKDI